jgi:hypothetical protein
MIVDFFRYGSGLSKGCLDYLLGEDRERENAIVLNGDVELTAQLIDSSPFAKKYTSGCLSFYEHDLSDQNKQQIMQILSNVFSLVLIKISIKFYGCSTKTK